MAAFIAKQVVGKQLDSVKGALGDKDEEKKAEGAGEEDPEIAEARREAEEKRNEKYRKIEEEREKMRQDIRDKYGIKKREQQEAEGLQGDGGMDGSRNSSGRKSKSTDNNGDANGQPAEESGFPRSFSDLSSKVSDLPGKMAATMTDATDKCTLQ